MEVHGMQRRLAAIMSADVVGYSALMAADEEGTLTRLVACREELINPVIAAHSGRVVKLMGDGLLVEFPSVVEAVRAAIEIQQQLSERNAQSELGHQLTFRIGINQGDVVIDADDIYGDGVNISARLQERATAGGICISQRVYDDVRGRIDVGIDDLGDQELKNIPSPVRVYRVLTGPDIGAGTPIRVRSRHRMIVATVLALIVAGSIGVWLWPEPSLGPRPVGAAKPSIAVLPFADLSKNPSEEYFSDGITNDLINDLSKFRELLVIASNSVFAYKGRAVNVRDVARELNVRYVLEGSVQKAGQRVRINAQLIDGKTGQQLWAERYDEAVDDIFDLQERITRHIVRTLAVRLSRAELKRAVDKPTDNLEAYDYVLQGRALFKHRSRSENFRAREMFRRAIELDPDFASAYAGLGWTYLHAVLYGWTGATKRSLKRTNELANKALALSNSNIDGRKLLVRIYLMQKKYDSAMVEAERVLAINPNDAEGHVEQANVMLFSGRIDGAVRALETAARFDPSLNPEANWFLATAYYLKGRYGDAVRVLEQNIRRRSDNAFDFIMLAASYAQLGDTVNAAKATKSVRRLHPFFTVNDFTLFQKKADAEKIASGLRKAGLD